MTELKAGWTRVKFAQLVDCVNDRIDDLSQAGVDRYVGLEHLDPECLAIRRWGTPDDMKGTAIFLSSHASDYLNGAVIPVDGGYTAK